MATNCFVGQFPLTQLAFTVVADTEYQIMLDTLDGYGYAALARALLSGHHHALKKLVERKLVSLTNTLSWNT